ncbi:Ppx/GppA phosphatase family protein [Fodinibius sediminis]|nr:Ppx/GppA phosphatase family protein [Fodinibius sediminis]
MSSVATPVKRIAALDLGTNSFHVVLVDIYPDGHFHTIDKLKEMVVLAEKGMKHQLSEAAMDRGIAALRRIKILCDSQGVEQILAYATSAIREAENGGAFIQRMIDETGIKAHAISGRKEAQLIGKAVKHAVSYDGETVLIVDIGGGSVEFIVANQAEVFYSTSEKVGVARMTAEYVSTDPMAPVEIKRLQAHYSDKLSDLFVQLDRHKIRTLIGSSGTMENIAAMVASRQSITASLTLNELTFSARSYKEFHQAFIKMNRRERLGEKGLDEKRVDIIAPGLVLLELIIRKAGIERIKISESALREGMIWDYIDNEKEALELDLLEREGAAPRRRSVFELLRKCSWHEKHSRHVTKMALQLFDFFQDELALPDGDRELLEYAGYLHDIGYYISHRKHHKHALYIIRNADLRGFTEDEINVMANVARYHRRSTPKKRHKRYRKLDKPLRQRVKKMAALLRVADGLDRSHYQNVQQLEIEDEGQSVTLYITTEADPELEIWGAMRKAHLFEQVLGKSLEIYSKEKGKVVDREPPDPFPEHKA